MKKKSKNQEKADKTSGVEEETAPPESTEAAPEPTTAEVPAPEAPKPPPTELMLDAAAGSEVHLSQLGLLNKVSTIKQIQAEIATAESQIKHMREKLTWENAKLQEERGRVLGILSKHGVPDGWRFNRQPDGGYKFFQPPPPAPPGQQLPVG